MCDVKGVTQRRLAVAYDIQLFVTYSQAAIMALNGKLCRRFELQDTKEMPTALVRAACLANYYNLCIVLSGKLLLRVY